MKATAAQINALLASGAVIGPRTVLPGDPNSAILPVPLSVNMIWRSVVIRGKLRVMKSKRYRQWIEEATPRVKHMAPRTGPASICIELMGTKKTTDIDNAPKGVLDLLKIVGVLKDDNPNHVQELIVRWRPEKINGQPAARVTIQDCA